MIQSAMNSFLMFKNIYECTAYRKLLTPVLFLALLPSMSVGEIKTVRISMSKIISLNQTQLNCLGEFKMG